MFTLNIEAASQGIRMAKIVSCVRLLNRLARKRICPCLEAGVYRKWDPLVRLLALPMPCCTMLQGDPKCIFKLL